MKKDRYTISADFNTFAMKSFGASYIHSSFYNYKTILEKDGRKDFNKFLENIREELDTIINKRLEFLDDLTMQYIKQTRIGGINNNKNIALKNLNQYYQDSLEGKGIFADSANLLGSSVKIKTLAMKNLLNKETIAKEGDFTLEKYQKQILDLYGALEQYTKQLNERGLDNSEKNELEKSKNLINSIFNSMSADFIKDLKSLDFKNLDISAQRETHQKMTKLFGELYNKDNVEEALLEDIMKEGSKFLTLHSAIGLLRQIDIGEFVKQVLFNTEQKTRQIEYFDFKSIGTVNTQIMRADVSIGYVVRGGRKNIAANVKSFSKPFEGKYKSRDFMKFLKKSDSVAYEQWIYMNKNFYALEVFQGEDYLNYISQSGLKKWEKRQRVKPKEELKNKLIDFYKKSTQLYNMAGFLESFLDYQAQTKTFVPEVRNGKILVPENSHYYSILLAMGDGFFWTSDLLRSIFKQAGNTRKSDGNIKIPGFQAWSKMKNLENPFMGQQKELAKIYKQKLKIIKKANGDYRTMYNNLASKMSLYDGMNFDYVEENRFWINPYVVSPNTIMNQKYSKSYFKEYK